jgi:hypothetical protein
MNFEIVGGLTGVIRLDQQPDRLASGKVFGDVEVVRKEEPGGLYGRHLD